MPAYAWLAPAVGHEPRLFALPFQIDFVPDEIPLNEEGSSVDRSNRTPWLRALASKTVDDLLLVAWAASSALALLALSLAALGLGRSIRRFETRMIEGERVLLADRIGPAVFGVLEPRIILPRWLAEGDRALRSLVLAHEREHVRARDQLLLIGALTLIAAMPWNLALWWQLRHLRAAIEMDCDARVLRDGADAESYSEALLSVRLGGASTPLGAVALLEPVSDLERRIRTMLEERRSVSPSRVGLCAMLALAVLGLAVAVDAPRAQQRAEPGASTPRPAMRESVYVLFHEAQSCLEKNDLDCGREAVEKISRLELNDYERGQLWYFRAYLATASEDYPRAIVSYENVWSLPGQPEALHQNTRLALAQLYTHNEQHERALEMLDEWFSRAEAPTSAALMLRGTIQYRLGRYADALESVNEAINRSAEPDEGQYSLRLALQLEQEDRAGAIETLEIMNAEWPTPERARQLEALKAAAE
ncbi:MAG TPA: M56 family metallopeptidase [Gammaproteobacteria bacterium]